MIAIRDVLREMERTDKKGNPIPFSIDFVTCNERTGEAGQVVKYDQAVLVFPNATGTTARKNSTVLARAAADPRNARNPQHVKNGTINIMSSARPFTKVNIWLIRQFNGERVTWHIHG